MARPIERNSGGMSEAIYFRGTPEDKARLKQCALKEGVSTGCFIRRALAQAGHIEL